MNKARRTQLVVALAAVIGLICFASAASAQRSPSSGQDEKAAASPVMDRAEAARLIVERNIFDRNRGRATSGRRSTGGNNEDFGDGEQDQRPVVAAPPPDPGADLVLTGVSLVDDRYLAFFEQTRTGQIQAVAAGESLAGRRVEEMSLDGVKVDQNGTVTMVVVGRSLTGRESARRAASPSTTTPASSRTSPTSGNRGTRGERSDDQGRKDNERNEASQDRPVTSPGGVGESNNEVLRRLMERRLQQQRQESGR